MNRRQGFTLIEMLLALAVLAIGLTTIFAILPGASAYSRDLRDRQRMRVFADSVFASAEWALAENPEDPLMDPVPWTLPTMAGDRTLVATDSPVPWPDETVSSELVPVMWYTLTLDMNAGDGVEVILGVRRFELEEPTEFSRVFPKGGSPW